MSALTYHPPLSALRDSVIRDISAPVAKRMRAIYYLRSMETEEATNILMVALKDKRNSPLLRHELAYVLGQMRKDIACDVLENVLSDVSDDVMVRHECAEALGAIGANRSKTVLKTFSNKKDEKIEVKETCKIAHNLILWRQNGKVGERPLVCACMTTYNSVDPAPPSEDDNLSIKELGQQLSNEALPLFQRYRAMFALRNRGGDDAAIALGEVLVGDTSSALLRHEVAYVLGQMQLPAGANALAESLRRLNEHNMVRHEAAEALGAIVGAEEKCKLLLEEFLKDDDDVVRESCQVALDCQDYWTNLGNPTNDLQTMKMIKENTKEEVKQLKRTYDIIT